MLMTTGALGAQPSPALKTGTLVRITTRSGERIVAPLDRIRNDTVYTATTLQQVDRAVPREQIRSFGYQDGEDGNGWRGAIIGGSIGLVLAYFQARKPDSEWQFTNDRQKYTYLPTVGAVIGAIVGNVNPSPHWIMAPTGVVQRQRSGPPAVLAFRIPF